VWLKIRPNLYVAQRYGAMPKELSKVTLWDIDFEREIISTRDRKGHASRTIKLKTISVVVLRLYLQRTRKKEDPFPASDMMTKASIKYKKRLSKKLADPYLLQTRLYSLRHYQACKTHYQTKNVLYTKQTLEKRKYKYAITILCLTS
jgi:site-specific recombinase XerD